MKNTKNITLCGIIAALSTVIMLTAYFPYLTYAIPAIAGCLAIVLMIECGTKWAIMGFVVSAVLSLIFAEPEAKMLFIGFFGYYPIIKGKIESLNKRPVEYLLKFLIFNVAVIVVYLIITNIFGIPMNDMGATFKYASLVLLALGNVVFAIYDVAVTRIISLYWNKLHPKIKKMFR
ncbi:MAG: hypothetical protein RR177_02895 [Oscillospiraceae bacterium]